jgi:hypothetical protein
VEEFGMTDSFVGERGKYLPEFNRSLFIILDVTKISLGLGK